MTLRNMSNSMGPADFMMTHRQNSTRVETDRSLFVSSTSRESSNNLSQILRSGTGAGLGLSAIGSKAFFTEFARNSLAAYIEANPVTFPGGLKEHGHLLDDIESVTFYPGKSTGQNIGIKNVDFSRGGLGASRTLGDIGFVGDLLFVGIDVAKGDNESAIKGTVVLAISRLSPLVGALISMHDITMALQGDEIHSMAADHGRKMYEKYKNIDAQKAQRGLELYREHGGTECLNCGFGETWIGPSRN